MLSPRTATFIRVRQLCTMNVNSSSARYELNSTMDIVSNERDGDTVVSLTSILQNLHLQLDRALNQNSQRQDTPQEPGVVATAEVPGNRVADITVEDNQSSTSSMSFISTLSSENQTLCPICSGSTPAAQAGSNIPSFKVKVTSEWTKAFPIMGMDDDTLSSEARQKIAEQMQAQHTKVVQWFYNASDSRKRNIRKTVFG
ncbi:MAG: hypothetical protein NXY57DRAFT_969071 [Lentinula lateritia]|nr:MAG: hypothetical protein NXY57DRAFT_969071 [Lentinula lateritia]